MTYHMIYRITSGAYSYNHGVYLRPQALCFFKPRLKLIVASTSKGQPIGSDIGYVAYCPTHQTARLLIGLTFATSLTIAQRHQQ